MKTPWPPSLLLPRFCTQQDLHGNKTPPRSFALFGAERKVQFLARDFQRFEIDAAHSA
jgi:hypothetical protein